MDIQEVFRELDGLFQRGEYDKAEPFMLQHLAAAEARGDKGAMLSLLNELMGCYRSTSRFADCLRAAQKALGLLDELGLYGSIHYATTVLNVATAYRAEGRIPEAIARFEEVGRLFNALGVRDARLVATLYNNLSLAWQEAGDHAKAVQFLEAALPLLEADPAAGTEIAVSLTNLALSRTRRGELAAARVHLERALALFEAQARRSGHYAAALAGLAEVAFREGQAQESIALYEQALAETQSRYGRNMNYAIALESLAVACEGVDAARSAALAEEARQIRASIQ